MKATPYREWSEWLRAQMKRRGIDRAELSRQTGIKSGTLRSYESGQRKPEEEKRNALADALTPPGEDWQDTAAAMENVLSEVKKEPDFDLRLSADPFLLNTMDIQYAPFSNGDDAFVDQFFQRLFRLSTITQRRTISAPRFDLDRRIQSLHDDEHQICTNMLGSLPRLRKLCFFWFPIRISLGVVCLRRHRNLAPQIAKAVAIPNAEPAVSLWPIVVESEVGAVHVQQTLGIKLEQRSQLVNSLSGAELARRLVDEDRIREGFVVCTVTDEITALDVVRGLGANALLVFPLTTTQAVETSHFRQELPAHYLGAAISRHHRKLREYFSDAWTAMLAWEQITTAGLYANLFSNLIAYATDCLKDGPCIGYSIIDAVDLDGMESKERTLYVQRVARAYARRALQLDRHSIENYRNEGSPWWKILERARIVSLMRDTADRQLIRDRVRLMCVQSLGEGHPLSLTERQMQAIHPLLEQEFDIEAADLSYVLDKHKPISDRTSPKLEVKTESELLFDIETITSCIQAAAERHSIIALETSVTKARENQMEQVEQLHRELAEELAESPGGSSVASHVSFLAIYRGRYVGCVDIVALDEVSCQLRNLFVQKAVRKHGVGRVLIRAALAWTSSQSATRLLIKLERLPSDAEHRGIETFFNQNGFRRSDEAHPLVYDLMR